MRSSNASRLGDIPRGQNRGRIRVKRVQAVKLPVFDLDNPQSLAAFAYSDDDLDRCVEHRAELRSCTYGSELVSAMTRSLLRMVSTRTCRRAVSWERCEYLGEGGTELGRRFFFWVAMFPLHHRWIADPMMVQCGHPRLAKSGRRFESWPTSI